MDNIYEEINLKHHNLSQEIDTNLHALYINTQSYDQAVSKRKNKEAEILLGTPKEIMGTSESARKAYIRQEARAEFFTEEELGAEKKRLEAVIEQLKTHRRHLEFKVELLKLISQKLEAPKWVKID